MEINYCLNYNLKNIEHATMSFDFVIVTPFWRLLSYFAVSMSVSCDSCEFRLFYCF